MEAISKREVIVLDHAQVIKFENSDQTIFAPNVNKNLVTYQQTIKLPRPNLAM